MCRLNIKELVQGKYPHVKVHVKSMSSKLMLRKRLEIRAITRGQKQPSRGVLRKSCSGNMQQIYRRATMSKCNLNKVALQLY